MKKDETVKRIIAILLSHLEVDADTCSLAADIIYADVVATAVDDERNNWILLSACGGTFDS